MRPRGVVVVCVAWRASMGPRRRTTTRRPRHHNSLAASSACRRQSARVQRGALMDPCRCATQLARPITLHSVGATYYIAQCTHYSTHYTSHHSVDATAGRTRDRWPRAPPAAGSPSWVGSQREDPAFAFVDVDARLLASDPCVLHCIALHCIALIIALHCIALHCIALIIALYCINHCIALH